ncbi:DUF2231 domain-containing protein [Haliea sp. E1-2-M8]|uniref:DUF2231 domain-containing protein n=1 Tax=Haliea sp. E1-2-M8 TaxID=3064706 RepID=UPI002716AEC5|nr:DUF2231 domain-containing protein [Haliea sp. E1-2-M8]MDO8863426.1 DUF2231 domain-containing protein [Haliea sp. E1-2-M8]
MAQSPILSKMAIHGHPLHPMLIHFPVAALMALVATDLAFIFSNDYFWARAGLWLAGAGALGGWVSGLVGLIDLTTVARIRCLINAWCHAILAVMLLSLATLNWLLRIDAPELRILPWGIYISLLTALLIAMTGILGGRLVYEYAVGVDMEETASGPTLP